MVRGTGFVGRQEGEGDREGGWQGAGGWGKDSTGVQGQLKATQPALLDKPDFENK